MKPIPIKVQKIIAFIPVINSLGLFLYFYNVFFVNFSFKNYLCGCWCAAFPGLLIGVLRDAIINNYPMIGTTFGNICNYLIALIACLRLIKYQQNHLLVDRR